MNSIVEVKNVSVSLGGQSIVRDVSLSIPEGDIAVIIGPNGSGKSTLIKAMLGLVPYSGQIHILGKKSEKILREVGYVPQRFDFDMTFPLTVIEFLMLTPGATKPLIQKALSEVDMTEHTQALLGKLSGGQLQRVLIARAILHVPKVLILDEPTSGIDMEGVKDFYEVLGHLNRKHGVTIIMISHELNIVSSFAHTIICLNKDLVCYGDPKSVLGGDMLSKLYGPEHTIREHLHHT